MFLGTQNGFSVQPLVSFERTVFYRERAARTYAVVPYTIAESLVEIPYCALQVCVCVGGGRCVCVGVCVGRGGGMSHATNNATRPTHSAHNTQSGSRPHTVFALLLHHLLFAQLAGWRTCLFCVLCLQLCLVAGVYIQWHDVGAPDTQCTAGIRACIRCVVRVFVVCKVDVLVWPTTHHNTININRCVWFLEAVGRLYHPL